MARTSGLILLAVLLAACGDDPSPAPLDAAALDAGAPDASESDAGALDAGTPDAGEADAGALDAGPLDAGEPDAGESDAGALDAGPASLGVMTAAELHAALVAKDFLMTDVHIPRAGVIPGTDTSIPYTDVDGLAAYLGPDLDTRVVLTCRSDYMSGVAGAALVARGYRAVRHLQGGMNAWVAAGYTLDP